MDKRVESVGDIIMASRIVVEDMNMPRRIVLRKTEGQYVVHEEVLVTAAPTDGSSCRFIHHSFNHGSYFRILPGHTEGDVVKEAVKAYNERAEKL